MSRQDDYRRGRQAIRELSGRGPQPARPFVHGSLRLAGRGRDDGFRLAALLATTAVIAVLIGTRAAFAPDAPPVQSEPGAIDTGRPRPSVELLGSRPEIVYADWADAQRQVDFQLLEPTLLPSGYELKRLYSLPYTVAGAQPGSTAGHVLAVYGREDGTTFTFLQYRFGTADAPTLQTIRSVTRTPPALEMVSGPESDMKADPGAGAYRERLISWISDGLSYRLDGDPTADDLRFVKSALVRVGH